MEGSRPLPLAASTSRWLSDGLIRPPEGPLLDRSSRLVGGPPSLEPAYPSICVSPQIDMACPEIVRPRGLHIKTI